MTALMEIYSDESAAGAEAQALRQNGWHAVVSGPDDSYRVVQNGGFVAEYAGGWAVFASRVPFR